MPHQPIRSRPLRSGVLIGPKCELHATVEECADARWFVCENPERPLDLHGLFEEGCPGCDRAWAIYGCPRHDIPVLL